MQRFVFSQTKNSHRMRAALVSWTCLAVAALGIALQPAALAQDGGAMPVGSVDLRYLQQSARDGVFQLSCAELAVQNGLSPDVRQLGATIVQDHTQDELSLMNFGHDHSINLPVGMSGEEEKQVKSIQGLHGPAFDLAYVRLVTTTHAVEAGAATAEREDTINRPVRDLVASMHDTLLRHLNLANAVAQKLGVPTQKEPPQRTGIPIG